MIEPVELLVLLVALEAGGLARIVGVDAIRRYQETYRDSLEGVALLRDRALRKKVGGSGLEKVRLSYLPERVAAQYEEVVGDFLRNGVNG